MNHFKSPHNPPDKIKLDGYKEKGDLLIQVTA